MNELKYYKRNGYEFQIVQRSGNVARALGRKGKQENHEVFHVQSHNGREIAGIHVPAAEFPPSNEQWGSKGWTFSSEAQAIERFNRLTAEQG